MYKCVRAPSSFELNFGMISKIIYMISESVKDCNVRIRLKTHTRVRVGIEVVLESHIAQVPGLLDV